MIQSICDQIQTEQRNRVAWLKSRIMTENRLTANVAGWVGYKPSDEEKDREKAWKEARVLIKSIVDAEDDHPLRGGIICAKQGIDGFEMVVNAIEKQMIKLAKQLPVAKWAELPEQRGFGFLSLAIVIGETGNLTNYANPAKVWRRMGCAPYNSRGKTLMGSTWKAGKQGSLSAEEWSEFGYSPRRRSVAYVIGENLVKQNQTGPYRTRWLEAKVQSSIKHPEWDWNPCDKCKESTGEDVCMTCGGTGKKCLRGHRHGMLLAVKLLLKNLWVEWNGGCGVRQPETDAKCAVLA